MTPLASARSAAKTAAPQAPDTAPETAPETRPADTVSALERGIAVLRCFNEERRAITPTELARLTGIPRPTVTRLAGTLVAQGLLKQDPHTERYALAAGVVSLARVFLAGLDVRAVARPLMQSLAEATGGSVYLAVRDGLEMVLIEACRPRSSMISTRLDVGSRAPMANSALGRAYLGALPAAQQDALVETLRLARGTDWGYLAPGLRAALADMSAHGWCLSTGEFHREINSISAPLAGPDGELMALNCGGAAFAFTPARLREEIAPLLLEMAAALAAEIGGHVPRRTA